MRAVNESVANNNTDTSPEASEQEQYSVFSRKEKRWLVFIAAFAAMFSPLSSFVFYPAITSIANDLGVTVTLVNLAITTYMIVSGITPAILGNAADNMGRRPIYILALSIYLVANIGLGAQSNYAALLVLRMVQSAGSSGTISLGYGIISDIASPNERGSYVGLFNIGPNVAPPFGPVLGGAIAEKLGWNSIFWFLSILGGVCLILVVMVLPETSRRIVGNGAIPARGLNRSPLAVFLKHQNNASVPDTGGQKSKIQFPNPLACLKLLLRRDIFIVLLCNGIYYATYCCVQASLSSLFVDVYGYEALEAGLIYMPFGFGCLLSTYSWGKLLNLDYKRTAKRYNMDTLASPRSLGDDFPIEEARLMSSKWLTVVASVAITGYGWSIQYKLHVAVPLLLQVFIGFSTTAMFVVLGTLLTDLNPNQSSTAAASANLVRCALSASTLAVLQIIIDGVGPGWCFTIFGGLTCICGPLLLLESRRGKSWRMSRRG